MFENYLDLLRENGIVLDAEEQLEFAKEFVAATVPDILIEIPAKRKQYTLDYLEVYGVPCSDDDEEDEEYEVLVEQHNLNPIVVKFCDMTYQEKKDSYGSLRPIHRYSRVERFAFTVFQLLAFRGDVPEDVVELCAGVALQEDKIWNAVRAVLKKNKLRFYYNRIPLIIKKITGQCAIVCKGHHKVIEDFKNLHYCFESGKYREKWKRRYFPNLRFIALNLLQRHGAEFFVKIPFIRTMRKKSLLQGLFIELDKNSTDV